MGILEKNHTVIQAVLQVNYTGVFNKSTIAKALLVLDNTGSIGKSKGLDWAMQEAWVLVQCLSLLRRCARHATSTIRQPQWLQVLINCLQVSTLHIPCHAEQSGLGGTHHSQGQEEGPQEGVQ